MRRSPGPVFGVLALFAGVPARGAPAPHEIYERIHPAIVRIEANTLRQGGYYGTGSIISPDGLLLTSTTVVPPEARQIEVVFHDGTRAGARLVLAHQETELAIVRVERKGKEDRPLPFLPWGDSDSVRVGDPGYTAGDFWNSIVTSAKVGISRGVVSGRYVLSERAPTVTLPVFLGEVIETSASMNPGTDGGPLLDAEGRLVGLMSLNISPVRFQGVAVPANTLRGQIERQMETAGEEDRASMKGLFTPATKPETAAADPAAAAARERSKNLVRLKVPRGVPPAKPPPPPRPPGPAGLAEAPPVPVEFQKMLEARPDLPVTAVLWDDAGHLLTTCYNIENANGPVQAETSPGAWEPCEVIGWCKDLDLAVLAVGRDIGDPIPRAPARGLAWGDPVSVVAANPHPGGERHTMETGIVSATSRIFNTRWQLDVRTAHADSGGAVIDAAGLFAGLLAHVKPEAIEGVISGVSFMTPLAKILEMEPRLLAGEKIEATPRPFLGFGPGLEAVERGIRVGVVVPDSAALKGGLRVGDVILAFDGVPLTGFTEIFDIIQSCRVGQRVKLKILRDGKESEMEFDLGKRPGEMR